MKKIKFFPISIVAKTSSLYNKAFHAKIFTLFASSESEVDTLAKRLTPHYDFCYAFMKADEGQWFLDIKGIERIRQWILKVAHQETSHVTELYDQWQEHWTRYLKLADRLLSLDLKRLSDQELYSQFSKFYQQYLEVGSVAYVADSFMSTGTEDWLETLLHEELVKKKVKTNIKDTIRLLTSPVHLSFTLEEEHDLIRLAAQVKKRFPRILPKYEKLEKDQPQLIRLLKAHAKRFYWIHNNYYNVEYLQAKDFYLKVKGIITETKRQRITLNKLHQKKSKELKDFRAKKERAMAALPLSAYHKNILKIARLFSKWKDVRKSGVYIGMYHFDRFLEAIAQRRQISKQDLNFLVFDEIKSVFLRKANLSSEIKKRKKQAFFAVKPGDYFIVAGKQATRYFKYSIQGQSTEGHELRGVAASPGQAKGRVHIIRKTSDMQEFKQGEILVTNQTTPDFVPVMKKAAAIVTEQGGITSHAAVISRELKKPCVIGTKVATHALRDGELVEVDANNGIIRKLQHAV